MITKDSIYQIIAGKLESDDAYIVELKVSADNKINVTVDHYDGIPISYCIEISRLIESNLDREVEDFELEVASAGIGQPFKVYKQYIKNINRDIEVILLDGKKLKGILTSADQNGFTVACEEKVKIEGKKKKELQIKQYMFNFDSVKQVKDIVSFK
ncbi:MAG: ribosome assembly cofactor RimP [Marinilabiliaceae bacterium]|nr:ribosome assembly cofactor RimP [Marinilabiliaceae bacterium]